MKGIGGRIVTRAFAAALLAGFAAAAPVRAEDTSLDALVTALGAQAAGGLASLEQFIEGLDPMLRETASSVLAAFIEDSRDQAVAAGVAPIPASIRAALGGYVPEDVLDRVRWCVACGGPFSLQHSTFLFRNAPAITLDDVVVFERNEDALEDPSLWVHELKHVMQYRAWGVAGFASRYLADYEAVESEAAEFRWQWMKKTKYLERRRTARRAAARG